MESKEFISALWYLFMLYILLLMCIGGDLWAGIRKAKKRGEIRSSYGYRKTIDKIAKYFNALMVLSVMDCMQMVGVWHLHTYNGYSFPIFPFVTLIGAFGFGLIEFKSIFEKAETKDKVKYQQIANLGAEIAKSKTDPNEIAKALVGFLKEEEGK